MSGLAAVVRALAASPEAGIDAVGLEPQAEPAPAPGEVVVAVRATQVNWVDVLMASGQYQHVPPVPYTPGLEYAGVIARAGEGSRWREGDRVISDGFRTGPRSDGPWRRNGGFATWAVAPDDGVMALPDGFSFAEGCCFLGNYETAWHVLAACGQVRPGDTVLVHGASGGTGLAAVHVAKHLGAAVIATGRSPDKLAIATAHGADHVVVVRMTDEGPRFRDEVKALTGGRGVDVVYDGVGGDVSIETLRCVAFGARFLIVGWASTPAVARRGVAANVLPTNLILMKGLRVQGCPMYIATQHDPGLRAPRLEGLRGLVATGVRPRVGATYPLSEVRAAMRAKWESRVVGGIVLEP